MTNFPILIASSSAAFCTTVLRDGAAKRLTAAIEALLGAEAAGGIANVAFKEANERVNRAFGDCYRDITVSTHIAGDRVTAETPKAVQQIDDAMPGLHTALSLLKKAEAAAGQHKVVDNVLPLLREIAPIAEAVAAIKAKGLIVKRQPKPVEDTKAKYQAPMASLGAVGVVKGLLEEITEGSHESLKDTLAAAYQRQIAAFFEAQTKANAGGKALRTAISPVISAVISDSKYDAALRGSVFTLSENHVEMVEKMAARAAEEIRDKFVYKNLAKIDSIVTAKPDLIKGEIIGREISLGALSGTMRFTFADGASFVAKNTVKTNYSVHGTPFLQFPLNFSNVRLAGGVTMDKPSEQRMNTVFVGKEG